MSDELDAALETMDIVERVSLDEEAGVRKVLLQAGNAPADLMSALVQSGTAVSRFERSLAPLEDIFVRVVQEGA